MFVASLSFNLISSADSVGNSDVITEDDAINVSKEYLSDSDDFNVTGNLTVMEIELEKEKNVLVYNIELKDESDIEYQVIVNAETEVIISSETLVIVDEGTEDIIQQADIKPEKSEKPDVEAKEKKPKTQMKFMAEDDDKLNGKYVSFEYNDSTGEITNFTLGATPVFSSILIDDWSPVIKHSGSEIRFEMKSKSDIDDDEDGLERITLEIHDNPNGLIKVDMKGTRNVTFVLSDDISGEVNDAKNAVNLSGALNGTLVQIGHENGTVDFSTDGNKNFTANVTDAKLMFRTHPVTVMTQAQFNHRSRVTAGIMAGDVGAEVDIEDGNSSSTVVYDSLNISIEQVENNTVSINISSELSQGTTVSLSVSSDILEVIQKENVTILFDGKQIQMADNYDDIMNPDDDDGAAEYLVVVGSEDVEVLVSIPHFSAHSITITTGDTGDAVAAGTDLPDLPATEEEATGVPGFGSVLATLGLLMVYLLGRRE
ncbi:MAG: PepSY domain-containing protein [ANME-2 cluster archaeon]|nr:PepSY domain-containing protein [ANME-2 cluster archaeon]MBC2701447.1 PepSY domain-containing protein [ANME-2 cluster archaeon]MBC2762138.1 PepSY domain-containing protein [ANME-2 cluster archaeon]